MTRTSITKHNARGKTSWRARVWVDGKVINRYFPLRRQAQEWVKSYKPTSYYSLSFRTFSDTVFWPQEMSADLAKNTVTQQRILCEHYLLPEWGETLLREITQQKIEQWRTQLKNTPGIRSGQPLSRSTYGQVYWLFHKMMTYAIRTGLAEPCLPPRSRLPKMQPTRPARWLTPDEVERFARCAGPYELLIRTLAYGGFRIGEAVALRVNDLDLDHGLIRVDEQLDRNGHSTPLLKTSRSQRAVPMPGAVLERIVLDVDRRGIWKSPEALLFVNRRCEPIRRDTFRRRTFSYAAEAAQVAPLTPHALRHTAASAWFDEGFTIEEVARFLGESTEVASTTYVHMFQGRQIERMKKMDERIARARPELRVVR